MNWFKKVVFQHYADFSGRARRSEYWYFCLFYFIISMIFGAIDYALGFQFLGLISGLALLIPSIAVMVRRLHDIGKDWYWILMIFIPIANLVLLYFMIIDSEPGKNRFGPNPKGA